MIGNGLGLKSSKSTIVILVINGMRNLGCFVAAAKSDSRASG